MRFLTLACSALLLAASGSATLAADKPDDAKAAETTDDHLEPFPAPKSIQQSAVIAGRTVKYTATVGSIPVKDDKGKVIGEVVYTAYTVPGAPTSRPVTFAFNGGPGAASVYLNLGAIGPKKVAFGAQGDAPSDPAVLRDNANSWLDFTDLVFIDPVSTGYSRFVASSEDARKSFYSVDGDANAIALVIRRKPPVQAAA